MKTQPFCMESGLHTDTPTQPSSLQAVHRLAQWRSEQQSAIMQTQDSSLLPDSPTSQDTQDCTRTVETGKASSGLALRETNLPDRAELKQR